MAINLADKFSSKVAERFKRKSYTAGMASNAYDFDGVQSIKVYSVDTVPLADYNRNASSNRYGTPAELTDSVQVMQMKSDKSFTYTVDKGNNKDQLDIKKANTALQREIDERVQPFVDKYNLKKWAGDAGSFELYTTAPNKNTALEMMQNCTETLDEAAVPESGRTMICTPEYIKLLKQNPNFVYTDKQAADAMVRGKFGELDGMALKKVPKSYMPEGVDAMVVHSSALLAPMKLKDYKIHIDPPGINGNLVEGRIYHDAFVLDAKAAAVCVIANNSTTHPVVTASKNDSAIDIALTGAEKAYYTIDGSDPRCSGNRVEISANTSVSGNAGDTVRVIGYNANSTLHYSAEATAKI